MSRHYGANTRNTEGSSGSVGAPPVELEQQFVMRLPAEPAAALREALKAGASNIKDRLKIQLESEKEGKGGGNNYLRRGAVHFDGWQMNAKLMDLPTIVESMKTIDKKTFYKTADICQILMCKEGPASDEEDHAAQAEQAAKNKSGSKEKVDKKYLYRHGLCPPLKNCRRRRYVKCKFELLVFSTWHLSLLRFRRTMKKKFVEAPEIEKEVKRLLRVDNEAVSVKWELVTEEELSAGGGKLAAGSDPTAGATEADGAGPSQVETDDLFGNLSDLDDEEGKDSSRVDIDIDSEGDSNMYAANTEAGQAINDEPSSSLTAPGPTMGDESGSSALPTSFSKDMFQVS